MKNISLLFFGVNVRGALSSLRQILATESHSKVMKNAFYFTSAALFVLQIFKFLSHILPIISRNKGNQTMKFSLLTEYNTRNVFLEKSYTKCDGETSSRPFYQKINIEHISGSIV